MQRFFFFAFALGSMLLFNGCSDTGTNPINTTQFKGHIYYSIGGGVYRLQLSDLQSTKLFSNGISPDITSSKEILCIDWSPKERIIFSDITGTNRTPILTNEATNDPDHKHFLTRPRISYDQKFIAYYNSNNGITYVIRRNDGSLVASIGDFNNSYINPAWAPDGSLFFQGSPTGANNGIYKLSPNFTSMQRIDPNLTNVSEPSISPNGNTIAFIKDEQLWIMGVDGSNPTQLYVSTDKYFRMPTWSPDSKYIAVMSLGDWSGGIHIFDVQSKTVTETNHSASRFEQMCWRY